MENLTESDKQFLQDMIMHYAASYNGGIVNIYQPQKLSELAEKFGLDTEFVELMGGID